MKHSILITSLLLCSLVHATGTSHGSHSSATAPTSSTTNNNHNTATAGAAASASQTQQQKQSQQQQQTQTANGGNATATGGNSDQSQNQSANANNAGNSLSVTNKDRLQAPAISAPAIYASNSCATGWSAGLSVPGGGISGGKSKADSNCDRREVARVLMPLSPSLALKVLCDDPIVKAVATIGDCEYLPPVTTAPAPVVELNDYQLTTPAPEYATKEELDRAVRLLSEK